MDNFYKCIKCGEEYPFTKEILNCPKHDPYYSYLSIIYNYEKAKFASNKSGWSKYLDLLPIEEFKINFDEQKTPLIKLENFGKKHGYSNLYLKDESKNPTHSFKDKEASCVVNKALEWGIKGVFVVSSGNAAVSTSAYANKAGVECVCFVPKSLSIGKRLLISFYGGKIEDQDGNYETIYRKMIDKPMELWNCTSAINPIREEGAKIIGFEIWENIKVPNTIIIPCGNGAFLFAIYKAFKELIELGFSDKLPKLIGVQIKDASPLLKSFNEKKDFVTLEDIPDSIAEGIVAQESYSSPKVMVALKETGGEIIEVNDKEIMDSLKEVIKEESIIPEPTSAVVFAALKKIKENKSSNIVMIQTAGGIKNLKEIASASMWV